MNRVLVVLLLLLVAWGAWAVFQVGSAVVHGRKTQPEPVPTGAPAPEPPPSEVAPPSIPIPAEPVPEPEPPSLTQEQELEIVDQRVRECIARQKDVPLPFTAERLADTAGREYLHVSVVRLEPDGIHVQHGKGLDKLDYMRLPAELKERFFIEDELALRYREVVAERRRSAEQERLRKAKDETAAATQAAPKMRPPAPVLPSPASGRAAVGSGFGRVVRCEVCGKKVPAGQIKVYRTRLHPGATAMGNVKCCPRCIPSVNGTDP
jgi:hypothetical protein